VVGTWATAAARPTLMTPRRTRARRLPPQWRPRSARAHELEVAARSAVGRVGLPGSQRPLRQVGHLVLLVLEELPRCLGRARVMARRIEHVGCVQLVVRIPEVALLRVHERGSCASTARTTLLRPSASGAPATVDARLDVGSLSPYVLTTLMTETRAASPPAVTCGLT